MASTEVTQNKTSTDFVTTSAIENREKAAEDFAREFTDNPQDFAKARSSVSYILDLVARGMTEATDETVRLDDLLQLAVSNDKGLTVQRDEARADVAAEFAESREVFDAVGGREAVIDAGLDGATPEAGPELVRAARQAADAIEKVPERVGKKGLVLKSAVYAKPLREKAARLDQVLQESTEDLRKDQALRAERDAARSKSQRRFLRGAQLIESLLRIAGLEALADRVRPSTRRPGNTVENDATGPTPAVEPAA